MSPLILESFGLLVLFLTFLFLPSLELDISSCTFDLFVNNVVWELLVNEDFFFFFFFFFFFLTTRSTNSRNQQVSYFPAHYQT